MVTWTLVLCEMLRVFLVQRVTTSAVITSLNSVQQATTTIDLPYVEEEQLKQLLKYNSDEYSIAGIHSPQEKLLLQWLTFVHQQCTGTRYYFRLLFPS